MIVLLDTSALGKLLVEAAESEQLRLYLAQPRKPSRTYVISSLAVTELRRLAIRLDVAPEPVDKVLLPFTVLRLSEAVLQIAGRLPHKYLGTLGAIHIATALSVEAQVLVTYDNRQGAAAAAQGFLVESPGAG